MKKSETSRPGRESLKNQLLDMMRPPLSDRRFWMTQSLIAVALLVHLGSGLASSLGKIPVVSLVWLLFLLVPIFYSRNAFGLGASLAVALEGIVFSIPQELLLPQGRSQQWGAWSIWSIWGILSVFLVAAVLLGERFDTERSLHEAEMAAELLRTEQRFQLAFANNIAGMLISDLGGHALVVNNAFCNMVGRDSEEIITLGSEVFTFHDDQGIGVEASAQMLSGERPQTIYTKRYVHKDGRIVWAEISRSLARDKSGNPQYFISSIRDITEERSLLAQLSYQAMHDPLTGLANRLEFEDRLANALARGGEGNKNLAVFLIDLDEFKDVNDTFGHQVGDDLLVEVSRRLEKVACPTDVLCRFGGDEFLYLGEAITDSKEAEAIARRLLGVFDEPFVIGEEHLDQAASIGVAICTGDESSPDLLRDADTALSDAKRQGKNCYVLFRSEMRDQVSSRIGMVQELRRSLEAGEIEMHYQPIVDLISSQTIGFEGLMRWNHPEFGCVPPYVFIPLAEQSKLIYDLGFFALNEAVREASSWRHIKQRDRQPYIAVNLSPRQFHDPELIAKIKKILNANQLEPTRLVLEITEGAAFIDMDSAERIAFRLRQLGVSLAIDDFGTGYSSLSYFTVLRPSILKIDQSFLSRAHESANGEQLLGAIVAIGKSLDAKVVAEGIETISQLELLRRLGCDFGQGYLFSPAARSDDLSDLLECVSSTSSSSPPEPHKWQQFQILTERVRSPRGKRGIGVSRRDSINDEAGQGGLGAE